MVRVAREAIGGIGKHFIDRNITGWVAGKSDRHRVVSRPSLWTKSVTVPAPRRSAGTSTWISSSPGISGEANTLSRSDHSTPHDHESLRRVARARRKNRKPKIPARGIEWTFLQGIAVDNHARAGAVARGSKHARSGDQRRLSALRWEVIGISDDDKGRADFGGGGTRKFTCADDTKKICADRPFTVTVVPATLVGNVPSGAAAAGS